MTIVRLAWWYNKTNTRRILRRMAKYKATINIDRKKWDLFKRTCEGISKTATEVINEYITASLIQSGFTPDYWGEVDKVSTIIPIIDEQLEMFIRKWANDELQDRLDEIEKKLGDWEERLKAVMTDEETDELSIGDTRTDASTDKRAEAKTDNETDADEEEEEGTRNYYFDGEVAEEEGLTRETVRRYRKSMRQPKDPTFWERWKIKESGRSWIKAK